MVLTSCQMGGGGEGEIYRWNEFEFIFILQRLQIRGPRRGSSVGRARDSWWGGPGLDPRCGRPLPTGWVGVSSMWPAETEVMVSPLCLACDSTYNFQTSVLGPIRDIALLLTRTGLKPNNLVLSAFSAFLLCDLKPPFYNLHTGGKLCSFNISLSLIPPPPPPKATLSALSNLFTFYNVYN